MAPFSDKSAGEQFNNRHILSKCHIDIIRTGKLARLLVEPVHLEKTSWTFQDMLGGISDAIQKVPKNPATGFPKMAE